MKHLRITRSRWWIVVSSACFFFLICSGSGHGGIKENVLFFSDSANPIEDRITAAKACFSDAPLHPEVFTALVDVILVERPQSVGSWREAERYIFPFAALLIDKEESIPVFAEMALTDDVGTNSRLIGIWALGEQARRGIDSSEYLKSIRDQTDDHDMIDSMIETIVSEGVFSEENELVPEYLMPSEPPRPLSTVKDFQEARQIALTRAKMTVEKNQSRLTPPVFSAQSKSLEKVNVADENSSYFNAFVGFAVAVSFGSALLVFLKRRSASEY